MDKPERSHTPMPDDAGAPPAESGGVAATDSEAGIVRRRPRSEGDVAAQPPVQIALALLIVFIFLLVLWVAWPFLSGA
jgi:hypothetical protein